MLNLVRDFVPSMYPFVFSAYSAPSSLYWGDKILLSREGVQQGDPLGRLLFCLTIYPIQSQLQSELQLLYLDNITTGGSLEQLQHDIQLIEEEF